MTVSYDVTREEFRRQCTSFTCQRESRHLLAGGRTVFLRSTELLIAGITLNPHEMPGEQLLFQVVLLQILFFWGKYEKLAHCRVRSDPSFGMCWHGSF
jgi:hypothetical protein